MNEIVGLSSIVAEGSVTQEHLERLLDSANEEIIVFRDKEVIISYLIPSRGNFTVTGRAAVVDPKKFSLEKGKEIARKDAINQLWQLEGYLLQVGLSGQWHILLDS